MSCNKERKEKICLNCHASLHGRYCHVCGQENIEPKENFWHLVNHFVEDITHFDGKFFVTLKDLLLRPGVLSTEYLRGKRAGYLHPIRMYVFTSAVFFLIFFSFNHLDENVPIKIDTGKIQKEINIDSDLGEKYYDKDATGNKAGDSAVTILDSIKKKKQDNVFVISGDTFKVNSVKGYASLQAALPPKKRDGWFKRIYTIRSIGLKQNLFSYNEAVYKKLGNKLLHNIPEMMFILLPLFALVLKLLYFRKKQLLFVDHAIFIVHLFIAIYMLWLFSYGFRYFGTLTGIKFLKWIAGLMFFVIMFYQYKAMRNFYGQSRKMTIFKFCIFNFITFIIFLFIGIIFFLNTASVQIN